MPTTVDHPTDDQVSLGALFAQVPDGLVPVTRFMQVYGFAIDEVTTKLEILREEFALTHAYNPIEHVTSRVKSPEGIIAKAMRKGTDLDLASLRREVHDIAGVRIVCSFVTDVYWVLDMLTRQTDVDLVEIEDYVAEPKANGYRSVHAIVRIPVFLSTGVQHVPVEMQVRTVAMDFWASLEHKIFYKHEGRVPDGLREELLEAATVAAALDLKMYELHRSIETDA